MFATPTRATPRRDSGYFVPQLAPTVSLRETMLPDEYDGLTDTKAKCQATYDSLAFPKQRRHDFSAVLTQTPANDSGVNHSSSMQNEIDEKQEENQNAKMNITDKMKALLLRVSDFNSANEYSKHMAIDDVQWTEEQRLDIPDSFKLEIGSYINSAAATSIRLERGISGHHGCLWYIVNNRLLIWFFEANKTAEYTFETPIQAVGSLQ